MPRLSSPHDQAPPVAHHHDPHDQDAVHRQGEILDWDAEVLAEVNDDIIGWLPLDASPRQILDLGCGTGAGTFALLDRFPEAHITAVDASAEHLQRLHVKASARGVQTRVRTMQADLDDPVWPGASVLDTPDLVWASSSLHHLADPDQVLNQVHDLVGPRGVFAVVELAGFPRFLPAEAPEDAPGLEERLHAGYERELAEHMPHRGADWGPKLATAGFAIVAERTVSVHVDVARSPGVGGYALTALQGIRHKAADYLSPEDLTALDRLLDVNGPHTIARRDDLAVRTERSVWAARRSTESEVTRAPAAFGPPNPRP